MLFLTFHGFKNGDIKKLLAPLDGDDRFCGTKYEPKEGQDVEAYDLTEYPKLMITDF